MDEAKRQYLIVMRHGQRQDELSTTWPDSQDRPWDPPLSEAGLADAEKAAAQIQPYNVQLVSTSPFQRCLQTSGAICRSLEPAINQVEVDYSVGEVMGPSYLAKQAPAEGQSTEEWMWHGQRPEDAWAHILGPGLQITLCGREFAAYPEGISEAHSRYAEALEAAADRANGKNLLIVTHGEAVGQSVTRLLPWVTVYHVRHCGYTVAWREEDEDGDWGMWQLLTEEEGVDRGVIWKDRHAQQ